MEKGCCNTNTGHAKKSYLVIYRYLKYLDQSDESCRESCNLIPLTDGYSLNLYDGYQRADF